MILWQRKRKEEPMLLFHIGSAMVGGALFLPEESGRPKIIFSTVVPITLETDWNTERFLTRVLESLAVVAAKVQKTGLGVPNRIFCVLASPWYVSQTRTISLKKNTPFIFTEKIADELIKKEIKLMSDEQLTKYGEGAIRPLELKNIKTLLNGYDAETPLYQKIKELEMNLFISIGGELVLTKIESAIRKFFHLAEIKFSSFAIASFTAARDLNPKLENFLLVDVGGEITDIFLVKKSVLRDSISFPLGRNFFTRGVASELGTTVGEANSLISLFKDGHAEEKVAAKLRAVMDKLQGAWLTKFQESLANLSNDISIPAAVYLTADSDLADLFTDTIKAEQFSQYTLAESKFEIIVLNTKLLHNLASFEDQATRDSFLIIDCVYINRFLLKI